jgi:hypothetical protein
MKRIESSQRKQISQAVLSMTSAVAIAMLLTACGKPKKAAEQAPAKKQIEQTGKTPPSLPSSATTGRPEAKTFAQSIVDVGFAYDAKTRLASLSLFVPEPAQKSDGTPVPMQAPVGPFQGEVKTDGTAALENKNLGEYSIKLKCVDADCLHAEISVSKESGELKGTAQIKHSVYKNTGLIFKLPTDPAQAAITSPKAAIQPPSSALTPKEDPSVAVEPKPVDAPPAESNSKPPLHSVVASELLEAKDKAKYTAELTIKEIVDARRLFMIRASFNKSVTDPKSDEYFETKEFAVTGEEGQDVEVHLGTIYVKKPGDKANLFEEMLQANVELEPTRPAISVSFLHPAPLRDGLAAIAAGPGLSEAKAAQAQGKEQGKTKPSEPATPPAAPAAPAKS